jgi:7-methyl-GTP pyrophosphatase
MDIILASTSNYRRQLLERLGLPFRQMDPKTDETALPGELPEALAERLALAKARALADANPHALIIGSDQVAALGEQVYGKPGNFNKARSQLASCAGKSLKFHTGLALVCADSALQLSCVQPFTVVFRDLTPGEIDNYLRAEQPYDCAGSFKWEALGISLFEKLLGDDPTALEGLPLIALCRMLREAGVKVI